MKFLAPWPNDLETAFEQYSNFRFEGTPVKRDQVDMHEETVILRASMHDMLADGDLDKKTELVKRVKQIDKEWQNWISRIRMKHSNLSV